MHSIADLIEQHREHVLQRYLDEARRLSSASGVCTQDLLGYLPAYLDSVCALCRAPRGASAWLRQAKRHLEDAHIQMRLGLGYALEDVTAEFALLGQLLSHLWESLPAEQRPGAEDTHFLLSEFQASQEHTASVFRRSVREERRHHRCGPRLPDGRPEAEARARAHAPAHRVGRLPAELTQVGEERLRLAVEATGLGIWEFDPLTDTLHADARFRVIFGLSADEPLRADTLLARVHPEERERVNRLALGVMVPQSALTFRCEFRLRATPQQSERWVCATGRAFFSPSGRATRSIGTLLDISEQVQDRRSARRERHRLAIILESLSEAFVAFDRDWRFTYINREAERILGRSRDSLLGHSHWEAYPDSVGTDLEREYRRAIDEHVKISFEIHSATSERWFEFNLWPTEQGLVVYFQDITERKLRHLERERLLGEQTRLRERAEEALRESRRAVEVLEHGDPLIVLDQDYRIIRVNQNQERITGQPRAQVLQRNLWEVFPAIAHPESEYWRAYHRAMEERVAVQFEEFYVPLGLWASVTAYPTSEGGLAIFLRDVTERKNTEQFRERLIGIVSHDLRSPLHSISLAAEQLLRREDTPAPVLTGVRRIMRSTERMSRMIVDLLDFTRARVGGGIPLHRQPRELGELVRATLEEFEVTAPGRVVFERGSGHYLGEWDADRLAQVVTNLVNNALQHGAGDSPVEVSLREAPPELLFTVRNHGEPIPEDLLPHIFDPFRRAPNSARQGLGLGLYIVQQILQAHGGSISVTSTAAEGTTFLARLPLPPAPS